MTKFIRKLTILACWSGTVAIGKTRATAGYFLIIFGFHCYSCWHPVYWQATTMYGVNSTDMTLPSKSSTRTIRNHFVRASGRQGGGLTGLACSVGDDRLGGWLCAVSEIKFSIYAYTWLYVSIDRNTNVYIQRHVSGMSAACQQHVINMSATCQQHVSNMSAIQYVVSWH